MSKYVVDFFNNPNCEGAINQISQYFSLNNKDVFNELCMHYQQDDYNVLEFIRKFDINLNHDIYDNVYLTCRHATTASDNLVYFRNNGLLNLKQVLHSNSPLYLFLKANNIIIDVNNHMFICNGVPHEILHRNTNCTSCLFDKFKCTDIFKHDLPNYKSCKYREKMSKLENKLYHDKCQTEVFIDGTLEDIYHYTVRYSPEILWTIEDLSFYYDRSLGNLHYKWTNKPDMKYYILEFDVDINNIENIKSKCFGDSHYEIEDILESYGYTDEDYQNNNVHPTLYHNLFVLKSFIRNFIWGSDEKYGQLLTSTIIDGDKIRVIREHNVYEKVLEDR